VKLRALRAAALLALLAPAAGCYYLGLAKHQLELMAGSRPLEEVYADPGLTDARARKLDIVRAARRFSEEGLGLRPSRNYTTYFDTGRDVLSYVVSACRPDSFVPYSWSFPIVGSLPYKGFIRREDAEAEAAALRADGWDVHIGETAAYSTLGWFTDPVFSSMLSMSEPDLASTIIHELVHGTIYVEGQSDFNESLAEFVGREGALQLFEELHGTGSPAVRAAKARFDIEELFYTVMRDLFGRLAKLYASDRTREEKLARRREIFEGARAEFRSMGAGFHRFSELKLNNALVVATVRYGRYNEFRRVFERALGSWPAFFAAVSAAASTGDPLAAVEALAREQ